MGCKITNKRQYRYNMNEFYKSNIDYVYCKHFMTLKTWH